MELKGRVSSFVGGQMEIQNPNEGYVYRGEIAAICIEGNELRVKFSWLGKAGYPPIKYVNENNLDYAASLEIYQVSDIGSGRLMFESSIIGELATLFPLGGSKMDPARVKGLVLQSG